jgi:epoxyqueuosine reductase
MQLEERIKQRAIELGFHVVGIGPAGRSRHADAFLRWIESGYAAEMSWMARDPERRMDASLVLPGSAAVIVVGLSYFVGDPPSDLWDDPSRGRIARYAWGRDYHKVMTPMLKDLADFVRTEAGSHTATRFYVDTGPVLERDLAAGAGLGFVGKNTLLIRPGYGSYLLLGEVLTTAELTPDPPANDDFAHWEPPDGDGRVGTCGGCRRCLDRCPTGAFPHPYVLDSRRCISYWTIEHRGSIPPAWRPRLENWIFGCDLCQSVCPWVKRIEPPEEPASAAFPPEDCAPPLLELLALDEETFRRRFRGTPVLRAKRRGLLRNVAVALGNWGHPDAAPALKAAAKDPDPLIRSHAGWALARIAV